MKTFETTMSKSVHWVGLTTLVIIAVAIAILNGRNLHAHPGPFIPVLLVLILVAIFLTSTRSYEIEDGRLYVRQVIGRKSFELRGASVRRDPQAFRGLGRVFGNGGFFAFDGLFYSSRLGMVRVYARNKDNAVVIVLAKGKKLVLSPDLPDAFIEAAVRAGASVEFP